MIKNTIDIKEDLEKATELESAKESLKAGLEGMKIQEKIANVKTILK